MASPQPVATWPLLDEGPARARLERVLRSLPRWFRPEQVAVYEAAAAGAALLVGATGPATAPLAREAVQAALRSGAPVQRASTPPGDSTPAAVLAIPLTAPGGKRLVGALLVSRPTPRIGAADELAARGVARLVLRALVEP